MSATQVMMDFFLAIGAFALGVYCGYKAGRADRLDAIDASPVEPEKRRYYNQDWLPNEDGHLLGDRGAPDTGSGAAHKPQPPWSRDL